MFLGHHVFNFPFKSKKIWGISQIKIPEKFILSSPILNISVFQFSFIFCLLKRVVNRLVSINFIQFPIKPINSELTIIKQV